MVKHLEAVNKQGGVKFVKGILFKQISTPFQFRYSVVVIVVVVVVVVAFFILTSIIIITTTTITIMFGVRKSTILAAVVLLVVSSTQARPPRNHSWCSRSEKEITGSVGGIVFNLVKAALAPPLWKDPSQSSSSR